MITILTEDEKWALAQLCKRIGWDELRINAKDDAEAHEMQSAVNKLAEMLAEMGISPR